MAKVGKGRSKAGVPPLEWAAAGLGAAIALLLLGLIGWQAIRAGDEPLPRLRAEVVRIVPVAGAHLLDIRLINDSSHSAATVHFEVTLKKGGEEVETSSATVDYVPGRSEASGGLMLREDPRVHDVELRVTGFELP